MRAVIHTPVVGSAAAWLCACALLPLLGHSAQTHDYPVKPVPFTDVRLTGGVPQARQATNAAITMPFALGQCETSTGLLNFDLGAETLRRRAAGEQDFQNRPPTPYPFDDSDVFKAIEGAAFCLSVRPGAAVAGRLEGMVKRVAAAPTGLVIEQQCALERGGGHAQAMPRQGGDECAATAPCAETEGIIRNDTVWRDTAGNEIWCNGGHIIREGDLFYWVGYDTGPGRWPWKINLYSSRNLADWKFENSIIRMEGQFAEMGWAGRPALLKCKATGKYVIVFEADSPRQWKRHKVGFAVCDRIDGQYTLANAQYPEADRSTGDQSVYQEGDKAYLLATMDKDVGGRKFMNQSLAIFELSRDFLRVERKVYEGFDNVSGNTNVVPREHSSREAPHIVKLGDLYYWFSSALVGWNSSATMYATAKDLAGPWSDLRLLRTEPPTGDSHNTQHDFIFPVVGSATTTWVYVGDRYSQWTRRGVGRNIFLPLVWENDQPLLRWRKEWRIDVASGRFSAAP